MKRPCILIINDDQKLRKTLTDILRINGYEPLTAADGETGIAILSADKVNLVLLDLGLLGLPGLAESRLNRL